MNNILILFIIIIIFIIILFIDYNYCIENFAPKHKHKISKNKKIETFSTATEDCFIKPFNNLLSSHDNKTFSVIKNELGDGNTGSWNFWAATGNNLLYKDDKITNDHTSNFDWKAIYINLNPDKTSLKFKLKYIHDISTQWQNPKITVNLQEKTNYTTIYEGGKDQENVNVNIEKDITYSGAAQLYFWLSGKTSIYDNLKLSYSNDVSACECVFENGWINPDPSSCPSSSEQSIYIQPSSKPSPPDSHRRLSSSAASQEGGGTSDAQTGATGTQSESTSGDLNSCLNTAKSATSCNTDNCRTKEVNGITSKYTIDTTSGSNTDKVHWINNNDKFYLNKDGSGETFDVTSGNSMILTNVYYCDSNDAECPAGKYLASNTCTNCPAGKYKIGVGNELTDCTECGAGKYSTVVGATAETNCSDCPANSTSAVGSNSLNDCKCKPGYEGSNGGPCTVCPAGKYKSSNSNTACISCPTGKTTTVTGAVNANLCVCDAGYYVTSSHWDKSCTACPSNTYNPNVGNSNSCSWCDEPHMFGGGTSNYRNFNIPNRLPSNSRGTRCGFSGGRGCRNNLTRHECETMWSDCLSSEVVFTAGSWPWDESHLSTCCCAAE